MSKHTACIRWRNQGPNFLNREYSREHTWHFDGGTIVRASPSPQIVPAPWSNPADIDPEESFVASVASCHMLWFLHVAIDHGFCLESYEDQAEGMMTRNASGKLWISKISLQPFIVWSGSKRPTPEEVTRLHHIAHGECFIANSIRTEVVVLPV